MKNNTHFEFSKKEIEKKFADSVEIQNYYRSLFKRSLTLTEKIIFSNSQRKIKPPLKNGVTELSLNPNRVILPDSSGQMVWLQFATLELDSTKIPTTTHCDHLIEASRNNKNDLAVANEENNEIYNFLKTASQKYGADFWEAGSGIIHQVALERYVLPGTIILGTDSHTPNAGGITALGIGVGGATAVEIMAGFPWKTVMPKLLGIQLKGTMKDWTTPKDIILKIASEIGVSGANGYIVEYFGEGVKSLSATGRATICNMGTEIGATSSIFPYDFQTSQYLNATQREQFSSSIKNFEISLTPDPEIEKNPHDFFDKFISLNLNNLEPQINGPFSPDNGSNISKFAQKVKQNSWPNNVSAAFIGSCTNSSYEDLARVASIAEQAKTLGLKTKCPLYISPGSNNIKETTDRDGILKTLEDIGGIILANACGPCVGMWNRNELEKNTNNTIITSFNRNFAGRNDGSIKTHAFLMSPEMVIAKALSGKLDFNPLTDELKTSDNYGIKLKPENRKPVPKSGFILNDSGFIKSKTKASNLKISYGERIKALKAFEAWNENDFKNLYIICKSQGKCTTDQISPAGEWLKFRGNLDRISENLFSGVSNAFSTNLGTGINLISEKEEPLAKIAKNYSDLNISWVLIGDNNIGEGSSREHAALQPRYRNCKAVIAKSFARIFENNLKRHGLLALTFSDPNDYEEIESQDQLSIVDLHTLRPDKEIEIKLVRSNQIVKSIFTTHSMSHEQIMWFKKGGAINHLRSKLVN